MFKLRNLMLAALVMFVACSGTGNKPGGFKMTSSADETLSSHATQIMKMRPVNATRLGLQDEDVNARVNDAMDDYSATQMREWRRQISRMRDELAALPDKDIDPLTRAAMDEIYQVYEGGSNVGFGYIDMVGRHRPYIINQIDQPLQQVPRIMLNFQRLDNAEDVSDYLRRLLALNGLVTSVLEKFNSDADAGWLPPRPILEGALEYLEGFTSVPPDKHVLVTSLVEKLEASEVLSPEDIQKARTEAAVVMQRGVYPAYMNAAATVRERLPQASDKAGLWARPRGEVFYQHAVQHEALTDKSAEEIHSVGLGEVERILGEMDAALNALGHTEGSVAERMQLLARDPRFLFEDTAEGRAELMARINQTVADMQARLPDYFGRLPSEPLEVRPIPEAQQQGASLAFYDGPPADGNGPGIFWINLRAVDEMPWFRMPTLTFHEAIPGHHLQVALAQSQVHRPMLWRFSLNSAFDEGWALYAERLAGEMGVYDEDPYGDLGRLQDELFRAARLVVDTGLHHKRWTMENAVTYLAETTGMGEQEIRAEVLRYMAMPGQALSYKLGMIEILAMREAAREALGEEFDISGFHDIVLQTGPVSMSLLGEEVRRRVVGEP